jgi:glucan 1,3-beta-glucosidase
MEHIRGVNLGGWLVLERWITPSVFKGTDATDEYTLCEALGAPEAKVRLQRHREAFIREEHVRRIAEMGMNTVRLPIGYWLFGGEPPFVEGADRYVERVFEWADRYGLGVILDFHAAPGSQNGWDHSGRAGEIGWHTDKANIDSSLNFITKICELYGKEASLIGIEPLNEPHWDVPLNVLVDYYRQAGKVIRTNCSPRVEVIVSDAFRPREMSSALGNAQLNDFVMDMHLYQLFTEADRALDLSGHLSKVNKQWKKELKSLARHQKLLVGEWSAAMSELYSSVELGGRRRYSSDDYRRYFQAQRDMFEICKVGRTYWTVRTEDGGVWSLLDHPEFLG